MQVPLKSTRKASPITKHCAAAQLQNKAAFIFFDFFNISNE